VVSTVDAKAKANSIDAGPRDGAKPRSRSAAPSRVESFWQLSKHSSCPTATAHVGEATLAF